jgi:hypothetical protein
MKRMNIYSIEDQMRRFNITKEEAEEKIKNIKSVNVFSIEWQMKRFNITKEEAEEKIKNIKNKNKETQSKMSQFDFNSMIPSKKEHWIKKGYSEEESIKKVDTNIKNATKNCNEFIEDKKLNPEKYIGLYDTSIEYYLKKGYSEEDSKNLLKKRQSTFSLEKCIDKYGIDDGIKVWKTRQDKWIKSLGDKITNEMKDSTSFNHFLKKNNYDELLSRIEYEYVFKSRYLNSKLGKASKESMKLFNHLIKWCDNNKMDYYCGCEGSREFYLFDDDSKKIYAYDFTIPKMSLIFEFHGKFWHTKEPIDRINELGSSLLESYNKDQIKKNLSNKNRFILIELFEEDGFEFNIKKMMKSVQLN